MDIKTVYGFILLGLCLTFQIIAKKMGIDGDIETTVNGVIALALFMISGKEIYNRSKVE